MRTLNIDVTELVNQLNNFGYCTGIHKVTLDYIKEIRKNDHEKNIPVRYIYKKKNGFFSYKIDRLISFIEKETSNNSYKGEVFKHKPVNSKYYSYISKFYRHDVKNMYEGIKSLKNLLKNVFQIKNNNLLNGTLEELNDINGVYLNFGMDYTDINYISEVFEFTKKNNLETCFYIHDIIPIVKPQYFTEYHNNVFKKCISEIINKSDKVICISYKTKNDLCNSFNLNKREIEVIKNGYFSDYQSLDFIENEKILKITDIIPEINEDFILSVGTIESRKNQELLFDIWERYISNNIDVPKLVLVGGFGYHSDRLKNKLITTNFLNNKVIVINGANDNLINLLYKRCLFTIYPSFYEGWGLPVVESLYNGKICVTGDNEALKEASDNIAIHIDPFDQKHFSEKILEIINDEYYFSELESCIKSFNHIYYYDSLKKLLSLIRQRG